ncbi:MAG: hypothetical protein WC793_00505 [Candidatus Paceibacterota bacterium]|jgi:hypothetical protein
MERLSFNDIFITYPDGSIEPRQPISVSGVLFGPGVRFNRGVSFAGIDFTLFTDKYFQVRRVGERLDIIGIYQ